jgi:hypothetical protein
LAVGAALRKKVMKKTHIEGSRAGFCEGDNVVLARGTYEGAPGVFLRLRADVRWADITQDDGIVRSHPLEWLAHAAVATPMATNL